MRLKFPIDNDRDCNVLFAILDPSLINPDYMAQDAREFYFSMTEEEKQEIREYVERYRKEE